MLVAGSTAFVTGANRGIGRQFVAALIDRGAEKVYAGARDTAGLVDLVTQSDGRVVPVRVDLHDAASLGAAAELAGDVTFLVNNAGLLNFGGGVSGDIESMRAEMETNYWGLIAATKAFVPVLEQRQGTAILNVLTIIALAPMPGMGGYCASKAAAYSFTQAIRAELAGKGIAVHGTFPGGVDTDMLAAYDGPKANPADVAARSLDGVEAGIEDITPCDFSTSMYALWQSEPKQLERAFVS